MGERYRVLVVEDEPLAALALERYLTRRGFQVTVGRDGIEALDHLDAISVDAMITDLRMPRMDGRTLIRRVRERMADLPIVVMTGYLTLSAEESAFDGGPDNLVILKKPVDPSEIAATLVRLLER